MEIVEKKTCIKCKLPTPINEFYAHPRMKGGRLNACSFCCRLASKDNYYKKAGDYKMKSMLRNKLKKELV